MENIDTNKSSNTRLSTFTLAMLTVAAIVSLRNLPICAEFGLHAVFYLILAALIFFIPIALVTAELAAAFPEPGANYIWVSKAFGKNTGFFALWTAWMESITWFPAILAFSGVMFAHMIASIVPGLTTDPWFIFWMMLSIFWGTTFINFFGMKTSGWVSNIGVLLGTIVPGILLVGIGIWWVVTDQPSHIQWSWQAFLPTANFDNIVFFAGILLGLAGAELAAFHIREARCPQKDYPKALLIAAAIILAVYILGTLSIAIIVPQEDLSILSGLVQAFDVFFEGLGIQHITPLIAAFLWIGALAGINAWTVGPAKGLLVCAQDGYLPPVLEAVNKKSVPVGMLVFQAIIGTLLAPVFLLLKNNALAFWVLTGLSAQCTVVQYFLVFLSALKLRRTQPNLERPFSVPGGKIGLWSVCVLGMLACIIGFIVVFFPPEALTGDYSYREYVVLLSGLLAVLLLLPLVFIHFKKA